MRPLHHLLGLGPAIGQVLVVEYGNRSPGLAKHRDELLHELEARVEDLAFLIARIVAVLADQEHAVDREFAGAVRQRLLDGARQAEAKIARQPARQVIVRDLIDIQRLDILPRNVKATVACVAVDEPAGNVVGVRQRPVDRRDDREGLTSRRVQPRRPGAEHLGTFARVPMCPGRKSSQGHGRRGLAEEFTTR